MDLIMDHTDQDFHIVAFATSLIINSFHLILIIFPLILEYPPPQHEIHKVSWPIKLF